MSRAVRRTVLSIRRDKRPVVEIPAFSIAPIPIMVLPTEA